MVAGGSVNAFLYLNFSQYTQGLQTALKQTQAFATGAQKLINGVAKSTEGLGKGVGGVVPPLENAGKATKDFGNYTKDLGKNMNWLNQSFAEQSSRARLLGNEIKSTSGQMTYFDKVMRGTGGSVTYLGQQVRSSGEYMRTAYNELPNIINRNNTAVTSMGRTFSSTVSSMGARWGNFVNDFASFGIFMGGMVGLALGKFTIGAAMAREEAQTMLKFMGMAEEQVKDLSEATEAYAVSASKVSVDEMNMGISKIYASHKMNYEVLKASIPAIGDFMARYKSEGRTAQEAILAINDAMDGQFRRFQELGIKKDDLTEKGWDPSKPESFFKALNAVFKDRGWEGWANKLMSTQDKIDMLTEKIQKGGADLGMTLLPIVNGLIDLLTKLTDTFGSTAVGGVIALSGLAIMLGFLADPIHNVIQGIGWFKDGILGLLGPTGRLNTLINGTTYATGFMGQSMGVGQVQMGGMNKNAKSLTQTIRGLTLAQISMGVALGALAIAFIALYAVMSRYGDNAGRFEKATEQAGQFIDVLKKKKENLKTAIENLNKTREKEIAKGHDVSKIDAEIKTKKEELKTATDNLDDAEATYAKNKEARATLESQWVGNTQSGAEKELEIKRKAGFISEETYQKQKSDLTNMGALNVEYAKTMNAVDRGYDKANGTILKLTKGQSGYAKQMRSDPKFFKDYAETYWDWAQSMDKANQAWTKGDYLTWFIEGWRGMFDHLKLLMMEFENSVTAWWNSWSIGGKLEQYISKPFMDWWNSWSIGGWWSSWSILEILGLDNINVADALYNAVEKPIKDWWNGWTLLDIGRKLKVPESTLKFFQKLYCIIMGCSPGIVPALQKLFAVWQSVWGSISGTIGGIVGRIVGFLQQIYTTVTSRFTNTWNRAKTIVSNGVNGVVNFFMTLPSNFMRGLQIIYNYVVSKLTNTFTWAKAYVKASVSSIGSAFWSLVSPAKRAWDSVYGAVAGPISRILNLVGSLRSALGMGGSFKSLGSSVGRIASSIAAGPGSGKTTISGGIGAGPGPDDGGLLEALKFVPEEWSSPILSLANGMFMNYNGPKTVGNDVFKADDPSCCAGDGAGPFDGVASRWTPAILNSVNRMASNYFGVGSFNPNNLGGLFKSFISKLFSGFSYQFYYGMHKGPGGTMASRSGNCMDMSSLVCAIANAFGFNCSMGRNFWNGIPHRFATIAGLGNFDPTNWVKHRSWAPGGGGSQARAFGGVGIGAGPGPEGHSSNDVTQHIVKKEYVFHIHGLPEFKRQVRKILDEEISHY